MKLTKCANNHFYDADKYDECPHCGAQAAPTGMRTGQPVWRGAENRETERISETALRDDSGSPPPQTAAEIAQPASRAEPYPDAAFPERTPDPAYADAPSAPPSAGGTDWPPSAPSAAPPSAAPPPAAASPAAAAPAAPLRQAVSEAAPYELPRQTEQKTMAFYGLGESEPVVGWLVCVKGEHYGQAFGLKSGQNFIGRAVNMDVWLEKESSVSRNRHAVVVFEPRSRSFFVQSGESRGLTYLDGELVLASAKLDAYSKISVGNCDLIFSPFCGENFSWDTDIDG
ncbi:MAG: FHA domain-containing protein [Oscillospiraceae bacterium]|jgi:hypothetical protein|nr:FHA domain-containing protein [Oscillospiraceae bacterium]